MEASGHSMFEMPVTGSQLGTQPKEAQRGQKDYAKEHTLKDEQFPS